MRIEQNYSLEKHNTFHLPVSRCKATSSGKDTLVHGV